MDNLASLHALDAKTQLKELCLSTTPCVLFPFAVSSHLPRKGNKRPSFQRSFPTEVASF